MGNIAFIALIILILAILPISRLIIMLKRRSEIYRKDFIDSIQNSAERVLIAPEKGSFRGATNKLGRVKSDGTIALTDKNLHFLKALGGNFKIYFHDIDTITTDSKFLGAWRAGAIHLIVIFKDGSKIGFFVKDIDRWKIMLMNAVTNIRNIK